MDATAYTLHIYRYNSRWLKTAQDTSHDFDTNEIEILYIGLSQWAGRSKEPCMLDLLGHSGGSLMCSQDHQFHVMICLLRLTQS